MLRPVVVFSSPAGGNIESAVASAVSAGVSSLAATVSVSLPAVAATSGISGRQPHLVGLNPLWTLQAQQQLAQPSTSREYLLNDLLTSRQLLTSVGFPSIPSSSSPSVLLNSVLTVQSHQQQQHQQLSRLSSSAPNMCSLSSTLGQIDSESQQQTPCTSTSNGSPSFIKGERCVGCGSDQAIRVHYGASSCHGCKAFFRRSVFEGRVYVCSMDNNCDITNESRNRCRACRLRNCLEGGMNPKHVREERSKIERSASQSQPQPQQFVSAAEMLCPSEQEADKHKIPEEHQLTLFMCALEKQTEMLTDEDARDSEIMLGEWSRDVTLAFGLQNPQLVIKRVPIDWRCEKIMSDLDLYSSWYRAFVLHADWAMGIADFRVLPLADQTILFKQNFMAFGWITYAYHSYRMGNNEKGIPLGNSAYIPYQPDELKQMEAKWSGTYGMVAKRLIEMIVRPMCELQISEEEYCLLKTISLFQQETLLSESGAAICVRMRDRLFEALATHIERRFPHWSGVQRISRSIRLSMLISSFTYIGQVESNLIQQLTATDMAPLSGVPLEILNAQQYV